MPSAPVNVIRIPRQAWIGIGLALLAPWAVVVWLLSRSPVAPVRPAPEARSVIAGAPEPKRGVQSGTWGELDFQRILLEPPEEFIRPDAGNPSPVVWVFNHATPATLQGLWAQAGLSEPVRQALDKATSRPTGDTFLVQPPTNIVLGLSAAARGVIYSALAEFPENRPQREPFRFRADGVDEWFENSRVSTPIIALTRRLLYQHQNAVFFADLDVVFPQIPMMEERLALLKTLARRSALIVRLHVPHNADLEALARYWRHGRRSKDARPLLASLAQQPDGGEIDIAHLLPKFARSLLNTYPDPGVSAAHDCHWTSFNFFEDEIDERYSQIEFVKETLLSSYYQVTGEPMLGDILLFVQGEGVVVHSCVHIADGIVFTKNGSSYFVPWTLARLENVVAAYSLNPAPLEIRRYRLKQP